MLLILGSAASTAGALILMEHSFKQCNMPLYYAWVWINVFEIFAAIPLVFAIIPIQVLSLLSLVVAYLDAICRVSVSRRFLRTC